MNRRRLKIVSFCGAASACLAASVFAEPVDEFYTLEERMGEAQEAHIEAMKEGASGAAKAGDPRLTVLKQMDAMAIANLGKPGGEVMALGTFVWSWNLDLDLPGLAKRFERMAEHYPDDGVLEEVFDQVSAAAEATKNFNVWTRALEGVLRASQRWRVKVGAHMTLGQVYLKQGKPKAAKQAFGEVLKMKPPEEQLAAAKGWIHEVEHLQIGMKAPEFTAKTLDGKDITLASLRGKTVLLSFWASW